MKLPIEVRSRDGAVVFEVFVQPRAARDAIAGEYRGALKVKTTAPPVEGKANAAVEKLLAGWLGVRRGDVSVVSGVSSRTKVVEVRGISPEEVHNALAVVLSSRPHEPG